MIVAADVPYWLAQYMQKKFLLISFAVRRFLRVRSIGSCLELSSSCSAALATSESLQEPVASYRSGSLSMIVRFLLVKRPCKSESTSVGSVFRGAWLSAVSGAALLECCMEVIILFNSSSPLRTDFASRFLRV